MTVDRRLKSVKEASLLGGDVELIDSFEAGKPMPDPGKGPESAAGVGGAQFTCKNRTRAEVLLC